MYRQIERQQIMTPESNSLPPWLTRKDGRLWYQDEFVPEEKRGPWDFVRDFGESFASLREPLRVNDLRDGYDGMVSYEEDLSQDIISQPFWNITCLANKFPLTVRDVQLLYSLNFMVGYREPLNKGIAYVGQEAVVLAPERGAGIIKLMLKPLGFSNDRMPLYQASRVIRGEDYTVALRFDTPLPKGCNVLHVDDCGAAGGTEWTGIAAWESVTQSHPDRYASVVGAGVRRAIAMRAEILTREGRDFRIFVGSESNGMDSHYYLSLTEEEKILLRLPETFGYRVGDMGNAMELDSDQRQPDIRLMETIAADSQYDQNILELTKQVIQEPQFLNVVAERLRRTYQ